MNLPEPSVAELPRPPAGTIKFTYASGTRPLDGYTVKRGVGRGGFGEVYFATSDAGKEVALKLIRRNLDVELRGATQCLNLKHPNLIGLYDIRTDEMGDQWIIMEYVSGESLEDVIERNPNGMPKDQVLTWMRGLCAGVAYLHDHGIVHRDLKPGNIFVDEGTVKIGDYGLAKFISCSRRSGQTESVGTVHYMAPEIANGRYGREIDTYALGIILFEMLTGTVPFEGESVGEVLMKHLTAEPDLSRLEEPYRDIVRRALAKDPEVRLKTVGEMLALIPGGGGVGVGSSEFGALRRDFVEPIVLTPVRPAAEAASPAPRHQILSPSLLPRGSAEAADGPPRHPFSKPSDPLEEPVWAAIRDGFAYLQWKAGLTESHRQVPIATGIFIVLLLMTMTAGWGQTLGIVIPALMCYVLYYLVWAIVFRPGTERRMHQEARAAREGRPGVQPAAAVFASLAAAAPVQPDAMNPPAAEAAAAPSSSAARYAQKARRRRLRASWRDRANQLVIQKPFRAKLRELTGSMLLAAAIVLVVSLCVPVLGIGGAATYMWLATVGTLATWAVLVPAKLSEGTIEDQLPMRLVMLLIGGLVGAAAYGIGDVLLVNLPMGQPPLDGGWGLISHEMLRWPGPRRGTPFAGNPSFPAYVTFFATLFLCVQWWRRSEYTRTRRLNLWSVAGCMFAAWLVHLFWWFPQPGGMMVAGTMAIATQLASPWMPPSQRRALSEEVEQGA